MADAEGLACQRIGFEGGEEQRDLRHILDRGELLVHGLGKQDILDHLLLGDAELGGLFGDLLLDQRRQHKARADDIGTDIVLGPLTTTTISTSSSSRSICSALAERCRAEAA